VQGNLFGGERTFKEKLSQSHVLAREKVMALNQSVFKPVFSGLQLGVYLSGVHHWSKTGNCLGLTNQIGENKQQGSAKAVVR